MNTNRVEEMRNIIHDNRMKMIPVDIVLDLIDSMEILNATVELKDKRIELLNVLILERLDKMIDFSYYNLIDKVPVKCNDNSIDWTQDRTIGFDSVGGADVSTVFLMFDHNHTNEGPPILFETMVFGGKHDDFQIRCSTYDEAVAQHATVLKMVKEDMSFPYRIWFKIKECYQRAVIHCQK